MRNVLCCRFNFYDGPPFATGLPHYGHILAGTIKDIVTRFAHQSGFHVDRRFGWDCHGLPVVCVMNLPADASVGSSFPCFSLMFLLLLYLTLLLKEKWNFLAWILCVVSSGASYWSPALSSLLYLFGTFFRNWFFCSFFKEILKKQSRQDEPVKLLPSSGAALLKSQKWKEAPESH